MVRLIPGFVISQHQGGGKAEQYFLRGFDADHGTVKLVDGLKGPYFVEFGDFATAGAVNFVTKDLVDANTVACPGGSPRASACGISATGSRTRTGTRQLGALPSST